MNERIKYFLGEKRLEQYWQSFETFYGHGCEIESRESDDVAPVVLVGDDAKSHVTFFAPRPLRGDNAPYFHYISWSNFLEEMDNLEMLRLEVFAETLNGDVLESECCIKINKDVRVHLRRSCPVTFSCEGC